MTRSNSLLDPTKGFRLKASSIRKRRCASPASPISATSSTAASIIPAGESIVIAGRARVGSIYGATLGELAPSRRLYAGGGGSVRGFGFQELGPKVEVANPKFDPTDPDEKDDPTISSRPAAAAWSSSRSRRATASAITVSSASSTPARSMTARTRD